MKKKPAIQTYPMPEAAYRKLTVLWSSENGIAQNAIQEMMFTQCDIEKLDLEYGRTELPPALRDHIERIMNFSTDSAIYELLEVEIEDADFTIDDIEPVAYQHAQNRASLAATIKASDLPTG
ncbi:hypothetical protein G3T14_20270 [Methylobacterium sp. BTF04]|uniref:hypothetical protein n=1 Tax=Methylobacterium sp. BTF04 TaxID=2708300 RepID=UPI0013D5E618|nr:hypothetical protein [Methylobacterium sp. BTF04]NEU14442.1 hypothetical protein [Methylobacterium sp. BTF04]